jgi:TonB family protein
MGTWGSRAAYAGDDNPAQAAKACQAFRNPNSTETADILVFLSKKKYSYGGYADYFDDNVSVDKIALNKWSIIDRHYYDGEGAKAAGLRNLAYQVQIDGDILTINEGNDISRFNRCPDPSRPLSVSMEEWTKQLVEVLNKSKRYPPDAQHQRLAGLVILGLVINRSGRLMDSQIKQSSGFDLLDKESLDALNRAQPFAPLPSEYIGTQVAMTIPIRFDLGNAHEDVSSDIQQFIKKWAEQDHLCRGGSGDVQKTWEACGKRQVWYELLRAKDWCYGKRGQSNAEMSWHRCEPSSLRE